MRFKLLKKLLRNHKTVAQTVYLYYTLNKNSKKEVTHASI